MPSGAVATRAECKRLGSRCLQGLSLCMHIACGVECKGVAAKAGCMRDAGGRGLFRGAVQSRCMQTASAAGRSAWAGHARCCRLAFAWHARGMRGGCVMHGGAGVLEAARVPDGALRSRSTGGVLAVRRGMHALGMRNNHKPLYRGRGGAGAPEQGARRPGTGEGTATKFPTALRRYTPARRPEAGVRTNGRQQTAAGPCPTDSRIVNRSEAAPGSRRR